MGQQPRKSFNSNILVNKVICCVCRDTASNKAKNTVVYLSSFTYSQPIYIHICEIIYIPPICLIKIVIWNILFSIGQSFSLHLLSIRLSLAIFLYLSPDKVCLCISEFILGST